MSMRERPLDVILWGATGYTGQLVAEYLADRYRPNQLRWAIAGRNQAKLRRLRARLGERDEETGDIPVFTGDAHDHQRLRDLAGRTTVICSTVGPYARYGTPLVHVCIQQDTEYCDLTGEALWMRRMIDRYHEQAQDQGTRIVHACGFDAVPSDLGTLMVQQQAQESFGAPCHDVRAFVHAEGGAVSGGTVASMMEMFEEAAGDRRKQRLLDDPYGLVPGQQDRFHAHEQDKSGGYSQRGRTWTIPFPMEMINRKVVHRTNALRGNQYGRDFVYRESVPVGTGISGAVASVLGMVGLKFLDTGLKRSPVRNLLRNHLLPKPGEGPDRSAIQTGSFRMTLMGKGRRTEDGTSFSVEGTVTSNRDPGYGSTAIILGEAALCLARADVASPVEGGVLTPATGIGKPLIDRLREAGMDWSVST